MLKFRNRDDENNAYRDYSISMSSVQDGVLVEVDEFEDDKLLREETITLTPMDAAAFVYETERTGGCGCRQVGHGKDGATLSVMNMLYATVKRHFVGGSDDALIKAGRINATVPLFVVNAMRLALERMMETLLYPTTGSEAEEFG